MEANVKLVMHIVSNRGNEGFYDPDRDSKLVSTDKEVKVSKHGSDYCVIMDDTNFLNSSIPSIVKTLVDIFTKSMPNTKITFSIVYHMDEESFDLDVARKVIQFDDYSMDVLSSNPNFVYARSKEINDLYRCMIEDGMEESIEPYDDEDDDDPFQMLLDEFDYQKRKKKKSKYDNRSRVYRNCKNPKRDVRRHGVFVASSKSDVKTDERVIKDFLKDFIPGKAGWKKDFRNELADRWISVYAVTKKKLKVLEKENRKTRQTKKSNKKAKDTLNFTRRILSTPVDKWNDINR